MNRKVLAAVVGIVLVLSGAVLYVLPMPGKDNQDMAGKSEPPVQSEPSDKMPVKPTASEGTYLEYSEEALASAAGTKLLFFHAPWCPQCREIEASIKNEGLPDNVSVLKVDYDSNQALRQKYGVTIQTTFVKIDNAGNKIASYVAYDEPQFSSVQRELLP